MADVLASDRTLPHNLEAERSVLGAILLHNDAFNLAAEVIDAGDFFRDAHRRIFDKMVKLSERGDAIDLEALRGKRLGDVARRHRSVQHFGLADFAGDFQLGVRDALRQRVGDALLFGFLRVELHALALDLLLVALGHDERELARQQIIARVAIGDLDDLATAPEVVDMFSKNDFHRRPHINC